VTCSLPRNSSSSSSTAAALVGMTRSNINFPRLSRTATEMVSRCTSRPTYLLPLSMRVLLVVESCGFIHRQLTPQGRPFIMRRDIARDRVIRKPKPLTTKDTKDQNLERNFLYVVGKSSGSTRVSPTEVMKFTSPNQR